LTGLQLLLPTMGSASTSLGLVWTFISRSLSMESLKSQLRLGPTSLWIGLDGETARRGLSL